MTSTLAFDIGVVNMALCVSENKKVRYANVFSIGGAKDPIASLIARLITCLRDQTDLIGTYDRVVIEQQVAMKASKNYALSSVIFAYYRDHSTVPVEFVNPRKKFKILAGLSDIAGISEHSEEFKTSRGRALKKLAVKASRALAIHYNDIEFLKQLDAMKKQDDICDSMLMSFL